MHFTLLHHIEINIVCSIAQTKIQLYITVIIFITTTSAIQHVRYANLNIKPSSSRATIMIIAPQQNNMYFKNKQLFTTVHLQSFCISSIIHFQKMISLFYRIHQKKTHHTLSRFITYRWHETNYHYTGNVTYYISHFTYQKDHKSGTKPYTDMKFNIKLVIFFSWYRNNRHVR